MKRLSNLLIWGMIIVKITTLMAISSVGTSSEDLSEELAHRNDTMVFVADEKDAERHILDAENSTAAALEIDVGNATKDVAIHHESDLVPKNQVKRNPVINFNADISKGYPNLHQGPALLHSNGYRPYLQNQHSAASIFQPIQYNFAAQFDCGRCSRELNLCQVVSGIFTRSSLPYGYSVVSSIPPGTCNITVFEAKRSKNYFALRNKDEKYVLNGDWKIQAAGKYFIGGTTFTYSPSVGSEGEKLAAPGPLKEPLDLMLLYQSSNPGIRYEYRIPIPARNRNQPHIIPVQPIPPTTMHRVQTVHTNNMFLSDSSNIAAGNAFLVAPAQSATVEKFFPDPSLSRVHSHRISGTSGIQDGPTRHKMNKSFIANKSHGWRNRYLHQDQNGVAKSPGTNDRSGSFPANRIQPLATSFPKYVSSNADNPTFQPIDNNKFLSTSGNNYYRNISVYHIDEGKSPDLSYSVVNLKHHQRTRHNHGLKKLNLGPSYDGKTYLADKQHLNAIDREVMVENGLDDYPKRQRKFRKRKKSKKRRGRFQWVFKGLTECSRSCGGGEQTSMLGCERRKKNRIVPDKRCYGLERPEMHIISCNLKPCPARWMPEEWSQCSVSCGMGTQTRSFVCKQVVTSTLTMMVSEGACLDEITAEASKVCDAGKCPSKIPHWQTQSWSQCSKACGGGSRRRKIACVVLLQEQNDAICENITSLKPHTTEECGTAECVHYMWLFTDWHQDCSNGCTQSKKRSRNVVCYGKKASDSDMCDITKKPMETEVCTSKEKCHGEWFVGPWSQCNVPCGIGIKTRIIHCLMKINDKWEISEENNCPSKSKLTLFQECQGVQCSPRWYTSEWSSCSCDKNQRSRSVKCLENGQMLSGICDNSSKPEEVAECHEPLLCKNSMPSLEYDNPTILNNIVNSKLEKPDNKKDQDIANYDDYLHHPLANLSINVMNEVGSEIVHTTKPYHTASSEQTTAASNELYPIYPDTERELNSIPRKDQPFTLSEAAYTTSSPKIKDSKIKDSKLECMDRIKNCELVFRARLCKLKYYSQLCCHTCKG